VYRGVEDIFIRDCFYGPYLLRLLHSAVYFPFHFSIVWRSVGGGWLHIIIISALLRIYLRNNCPVLVGCDGNHV